MSRYDGTKQEPILMMERWPERFETVWSVYDNRSGTGRENTAAIITPSATWICHVILPLLTLPVLCPTQSFRCPRPVPLLGLLTSCTLKKYLLKNNFKMNVRLLLLYSGIAYCRRSQPWYVNADSDKRIYISFAFLEEDRRINSSRLRESLFSILYVSEPTASGGSWNTYESDGFWIA